MATDSCSTLRMERDYEELVRTIGGGISSTTKNEEEKDLLSGTLEACLKVLLRKKSATEDKLVTLQEELALAKERMKKLEHAVKGRGAKAKELAKKLSETTNEKMSLVEELKFCHQQLKEELEKKQKLQSMYTESLKIKNSRIKELETENEALRQARNLSAMATDNQEDRSSAFCFSENETASASTKPSFHSESFESSDQENHNWDPYFGGVKVSQDDIEGMVDNYDMLQLSYTEALKAKNDRIKQLESDFQMLKSTRLTSLSQFSNISSDLSIDSYQSDAFSNSYTTSNFLSSSADSHALRSARLAVPSQRNSSTWSRHARSQSLSDKNPRMKPIPDQHLRKPRLSLRLKMESFDSLSAGSSPTNSGSVTPTSTVGSYSGVLGKGLHSLSRRRVSEPRRKSEAPRFNDSVTDEQVHTMLSNSTKVLSQMRRKQQGKQGTKSSSDAASSAKETKQTRHYMKKRQKELESKGNHQLSESHDLPTSTVVEKASNASSKRPIIQISVEESDDDTHVQVIDRHEANEDNVHQSEVISDLKCSSSDDERNVLQVKFSSTHSKSSSSCEEPVLNSEFSSHSRSSSITSKQAPIVSACPTSEDTPQWKKDLIEKKRASVSSFKQQPTEPKSPPRKPEWAKKVLKRQSLSSSQDHESSAIDSKKNRH